MTKYRSDVCRRLAAAGCVLLVLITAGCGGKKSRVPPDPAIADQYLMERGREALAKKHWMESREFFHQVLDNYSGSPLRSAAKLAIGDSFLGEGSTESLILAANEYREFMTFYPTDPRLDYAQYQLALSHFKEMKKPDRTEERRRLIEKTIGDRFGWEEMAKRTLGTQWAKINEKQRQEFVDLFRTLLTNTYIGRIETY